MVNKKYIVYLTSILTPYVVTIFLIEQIGIFLALLVFLFSFITLIISCTILVKSGNNDSSRKWMPALIGLIAVVTFFASYRFQGKIGNYIFYKRREEQLNQFVADIIRYKKINQLSDGQRYWKNVNNTSVALTRQEVDTTEINRKQFIDDVLKQSSIDKHQYEQFRQQLIETDFMSFTKLEDGTLSFTRDGFLDNCYGFAYSMTGKQPLYNDCGQVISWYRVAPNWYAWATT